MKTCIINVESLTFSNNQIEESIINGLTKKDKLYVCYKENANLTITNFFSLSKLYEKTNVEFVKENDEYKFYPSKYIGYKNNSASGYVNALYGAEVLSGGEKHGEAAHYTFDGRMSNKVINKILRCTSQKDCTMSEKFIEYCNKYGLKGSEKKKFWLNIIEI